MRRTTTWFLIRAAVAALVLAGLPAGVARAGTMGFEAFTVDGVPQTLGPESHYSGYDSLPTPANEEPEEHPFFAGGVRFYNSHGVYRSDWGPWSSWEGWAVSNHTDTTTVDFTNQYSAITGGGVSGSANYAVGYFPEFPYGDPEACRRLDIAAALTATPGRCGFFLTNTTYAYRTMELGNGFSRKFTRENDDYFRLEMTGVDADGNAIAGLEPVWFYLADFRRTREPDARQDDYIVSAWTWIDLARLVEGGAAQLRFAFASSDTGDFGINTPLYVAMDSAVPEPAAWLLLAACATCVALAWRRVQAKDR
jgi:hypothetical protein